MPCYLPLDAYYGPGGITFDRKQSFGNHIKLPCGRCIGCKLEHAKEWALRCYHESLTTTEDGLESMFLTLTYATEHVPPDHQLSHEHFQKFLRKLRKKKKQKIRFFMSGEYGEPTEKNNYIARPHYHAIIFGYRPADLQLVNIRNKNRNYISESFAEFWPHGTHEIGYVSYQNAGYVARYTLKKQQSRECDPETGEVIYAQRCAVPIYIQMSNRPGLGFDWYHRYKSDLYPHDFATTPDGKETAVPKYYRKLLERENPKLADKLRTLRVEKARNNPDNTWDRMDVKHFIQTKKADRLKREL